MPNFAGQTGTHLIFYRGKVIVTPRRLSVYSYDWKLRLGVSAFGLSLSVAIVRAERRLGRLVHFCSARSSFTILSRADNLVFLGNSCICADRNELETGRSLPYRGKIPYFVFVARNVDAWSIRWFVLAGTRHYRMYWARRGAVRWLPACPYGHRDAKATLLEAGANPKWLAVYE